MKLKFGFSSASKGFAKVTEAHRLLKASPLVVKAGVLGHKRERKEKDGFDNVEIAVTQEFGTRDGHVPPRSFVLAPFKANRSRYMQRLKSFATRLLLGKVSLDKVLSLIGQQMAADMKARIKEGISPPNAESTIKKKKSTKPLVDTGQLLTSITYSVARREKKK